ncbi:hypothetical protein GMDG_05896 [Pseudogymnoascus destructans 20631-21]|uniref:Uncharacterized protein n=1 Tax=Pseudogymnoascus destructans (strain ATCC MYA-4855 / 20631-21) TaxID=658429 RepID=L8FR82_PSED2|nr:hypothetical protein GMDG_05896 [Pseudogymnoascus destructans 20631-21]
MMVTNIAADAPRDPYPNDFVDPEIVERPFRVAIDPEYMDLLALPPSDPGTPDPHHSTDLPALPDSRPPSPPGTEHLAPIDRSLAAHDKNPSTPRKTESRKPNRKAASLSAVPLTFKLVNRSTPSSSGLPRPSPLASPLTPGLARPSSLMSPLSPAMDSPGFSRTKARPTSWDNSREIKPLFLLDAARRESLLSDEERPTRPRSIEPDYAVYSRRSSLASARASVVSPRSDDVADLPALPESREASLERVEELPASVEEPTSVLDPLEQPLAKDGDVVSKEVSLEPEADQVKEAFGIERPHSPDQFEEPHEFPELPESRPATPIDDRDLQVSDAIVQEAGDPTTHADGQQDETSREVDDLPQPTPIEPDTCNRSSHLFQPTPQTTPIKHSSIDDIILEHPTQDESGDQDGVAVQERSTTEEQGESYVTRDINVMDVPMAQFDSTAREVAAEEEAEPVDEWSATPSKKAKKDKKKEKKARKGGYQTPPVEKTPEQAALPETLEEQPQQPTEDLSRDLPLAAAAAAAATAAIATFDEEPSASRDLSISDEPSIPVEPVEPEWALKPSKKDKKKAKKSRGDPVSTPADDTPAKSILPEADIEQPPEPLEDFAVEPEWTAKPSKKDKKKGRKSRGGEATPPAEDTTAETILPGGDVEQPVQPAEEFVAEPEWDLKPSKKDKKKANKGFSEQASIPAEDNTTETILPEAESEQPLQRAEEAQPADEAQPAEDFATEPEWALKPSKKDKKKGKKNRGDQTPVEDNAAETIVREVESEQPVQPADEAQSAKEVQLVKEVLPVEDFIVEPEWALKPSKKDKKKGKKGRGEQTLAEDNTAETTLPVVESDQQIQRAEEVQPAPEELPVEDFVAEPEWALKPSKKDKKKGKKGSGDQTPVEDNVAETILPEADSEQPIQPAEDIVAEPEWALKPSKKDKKKGKKGRGGLVDDTATEPSNSPESAPEPEHLQTLEDEEAAKEIPVDIPVTDLGDEPAPASEQQPKPFEIVAEDVPVDVPATTPSDEPKSVSERQLQPLENVAEDAPADIPVTALNDEPTPVVQQELQPYEDATRDANTDIPITAADTPVVESEEPAEPTWALKPSKKDKKKAKKGRGAPVEEDTAIEQQLQPLEDGVKDAPVDMSIAATDDTPVAESEELTEPTWALKPSKKDKKKVKKSRGGLVEDTAAEILDSPESAAPESSAPKSAAEQPPMEDVAVDVLADAPIASPTDEAAPATEPEEPSEPMWALKPSKKDKKKAKKGRSGPVEEDTTVEPLDSLESAVEQPPLEDITREAPVDIATAAFDEPPPAAESEELSEPTWALKPSKKDKKKAKKGRADLVDEDTTSETLNAPEPTPEQQLQPLEPVDIPVAAIGDELTFDEPVLDKPASDDLAAEEPVPAAESEEPFEPTWALKPSKKDKKKAKKARGGLFEDTAVEQPLEGLAKDAPFDIPIAAPGGDEPTLEELIPDESISAEPTAAPESEEPSDLAEPTWALKPSNKDKKKAKKGRGGPAEDTALEQEEQPLEEMAKEAPIEIPAATLDDETSRDELTADESTPLAEREEPSGPTWALKPSKKDKKKAKKNREGLFEEDTASEPLDNVAKDIPVEIPLAALGAAALGVATLGDEPTIEQPIAAEPIAVEPAAVEPTPAAESEEPTWALKPSKKDKKKAKKSRGLFEEDTVPEPQGEPLEDVAKDIPIETSLGILSDEPTTVEPTTVEPTTVEPTTVEPTVVEPTPAAESEEPTWALKPSKKDKKKAKKSRGLFEEDTVPEPQGEPLEDVAKDIPIETSLGTLSDEPTTVEPTIVEPTIVEPTAVETVPSTELEESFELTWALKPSKKDKKGKKSRGVPTEDTAVEPLSAPEVQPSEASANDAPAVLDAPTTALDEEPIAPLVEPEEQIEPQWSLKPSKKDKKGKKAARGGETSAPIEDTIVEQSTLPEAQHFEDSSPIVDAPVSTIEVEPIAPVEPEEQAEPEFALNPSKKDKKRKKAKKAFEDQASTPVEDTCEQSEDLTRDASLIVDTPISALDSEPIAPAESEEQAEPEFALKPSKKDKKGKKGKKAQEVQALSWASEVAETADDSTKDIPPIDAAEPDEQIESTWAPKPPKKDKKGKKGKKAFEVDDTPELSEDLTKDAPLIVDAPIESEAPIEPEWAPKPSKKDKKAKRGKKAFEVEGTPEPSEDLTEDAPTVVDIPAYSPHDEQSAPTEFEEPIVETFALKSSKKDKKAKKARESEVSTPPVDLNDEATSQTKTVDGFEAGYKEDQLALARQLQAEFGSGSAKSKKSKKKSRGGSQPSAPSTPVEVEAAEVEYFESAPQPRSIDGLKVGYEEDQLSLAKQLQAEFGSGSKKSKKGKKSRGSQGSMPSTPIELETAEVENTECASQPRAFDGLEVGYEEDQLSLAKQLQAEYGSGSKKSKGKKSRGSEVSSPSTPVEVESFESDPQPRAIDGFQVGYDEDQLSLAKQLQAEFGSGSKKSKKGKKNRSSSATPKSNYETYDEEPQAFKSEAATLDSQHDKPKDLDNSPIYEAAEAPRDFQDVRSVEVPQAAEDNSTIEAMVGAAAALGAIGVGAAIKHAVEAPEAPEDKSSHDIIEVPREVSQDPRSLDMPEYPGDTTVPQVVVDALHDLQGSRSIDGADFPEVVASRDLQDFESKPEHMATIHQQEKPEALEELSHPSFPKHVIADREIGSPSHVTSDYLSPEPQWHTPSRLPVVLEEDSTDYKKSSDTAPQEHIPLGDSSMDDFNRDSAYVAESPITTSRSLAADHEYTRDSGVHIEGRSRSHTPERRASPPRTPAAVSDDALARLSWPPVNDADETVDLHRPKSRKLQEQSRLTPLSFPPPAIGLGAAGAGLAAARGYDKLSRAGSPDICRSSADSPELRRSSGEIKRMTTPHRIETPRSVSERKTPDINRLHTPDQVRSRPVSATSSKFSSGTPPLRRSDRKTSGDLRSLSQRSQPNLDEAAREARHSPVGPSTSDITNPIANEGRVRLKDMADVYVSLYDDSTMYEINTDDLQDGYGEGRIGSPRSPTRPHSMRRRQSMQVIDLEARLEQLAAENRMLAEAKEQAESNLHQSQRATSDLTDRDAEIDTLKRTLDWFHKEVDRLKEINEGLTSANVTIGQQHDNRYTQLESQHAQATRELEEERHAHGNLSEGMAVIIQGKVQEELQDKDRELEQLRNELDSAREQIKGMQRQILKSKSEGASFLVVRNEDYFDDACQRLCEHVSQWILRFSKFSDMRACRLTSEISNDKIIDRLDNAVLDGSDVDDYLADRVRRRDIFMSMTMTMVWEYIFTRYLFGMDREQRQKLKSLEKMLLEVGPPAAVHQWRATTLSLLARRPAFAAQRDQDTEAVVQAIFQTLSTILPPPSNLEEQIQVQLRRVVRVAVNLSIEMRTQRAQYMMLPPLQPEYDANGDLAREVAFNAALMSEKISAGGSRGAPQVSGEDREEEGAVVQVVLFPLVVKQGDDEGVGEEEIVVCPAQVLVARPREPGSSVGMRGGRNVSRVSIPVSSAMGSEI